MGSGWPLQQSLASSVSWTVTSSFLNILLTLNTDLLRSGRPQATSSMTLSGPG